MFAEKSPIAIYKAEETGVEDSESANTLEKCGKCTWKGDSHNFKNEKYSFTFELE